MTLQDLGSIGEFVAAIATLATLFYLAMQIRQNTRALRAGTFQQVVDSFAVISESASHDRELLKVLVKIGQDPSSLSEVDELQYSMFLISFFRRGENIHFQYTQGALAPEEWEGIRNSLLAIFGSPVARAWWPENQYRFSEAFCEFVKENLHPDEAGTAA